MVQVKDDWRDWKKGEDAEVMSVFFEKGGVNGLQCVNLFNKNHHDFHGLYAYQVEPVAGPSVKSKLVIIESPFAGEIEANTAYAKRCVHDCLARGESPIASHLLFTQPGILLDNDPEERRLGIEAGHAWYRVADACVVYTDRGISPGMKAGIERAESHGVKVEHREIGLPGDWLLHVWALDAYAGAYDHCTEAEAEADLAEQKASGLVNVGYRYQIAKASEGIPGGAE